MLGFVAGLDDPGFNGSGGGARSGSELSHLVQKRHLVSHCLSKDLSLYNRNTQLRKAKEYAHIGTDDRPESESEGWCLSTSSRSRESSLSLEGMVANRRYLSGRPSEECKTYGLGNGHHWSQCVLIWPTRLSKFSKTIAASMLVVMKYESLL